MEPTLLVGDRLFVSKYTYGYSKHSFPFSPALFKNRIFNNEPIRGDLVVFKTPADNRTDYIKRLIGMPGDNIQFINGSLFINDEEVLREEIKKEFFVRCGGLNLKVNAFYETLPNGKKYVAAYNSLGTLQNSDRYKVPKNHYFFLGDNRDCSKDSRFLSGVGYVHENNLVGKAQLIFFSSDYRNGRLLQFWKWLEIIRFDRFFKKIK